MTEELSTFKIIEVAYKSRLLFPTAKEFEDAVGMKWRTIVEYYNNEDSLNLESCYNRINDILTQTNEKKLSEYFTSKECLKDYVGEYIKASNFYNSLNWRDRNHSASKKKFCRLLFRRHILSGKELGGETVIFGSKYSDTELFNKFFPNNDYENPAIDLEWILLFVFDIVRPWDDNSRVRENENQKEVYLERFHNLWKILQDDMVSLQGNPLVDKGQIPQDLRIPYKPIMNVISVNMYSHLKALWSMWHTFLDYKLYINNLNSSASENGINYSGIWIDDADKGETRFWVFLGDGKLMCFERNDNIEWVYTLYFIWYIPTIYFYEIFKTYNMLCFYKSDNNSWAVLATSINPCTEEQNEISIQNDNIENSDKEKLLCPVILPTWVNWRSWKRLNKEDILYKEFYNVLMERPPYSICTSESKLARLQNRFIGRDLNYIYIYDGKLGEFRMSETSKGSGVFRYVDSSKTSSLFELEISEEHPLYAIPVNLQKKTRITSKTSEERKNEIESNNNFNQIIDILDEAKKHETYHIIHTNTDMKILWIALPILTGIFTIDDLIERIGGRKFTSSPFKFQSENPEQIAEDSTQD